MSKFMIQGYSKDDTLSGIEQQDTRAGVGVLGRLAQYTLPALVGGLIMALLFHVLWRSVYMCRKEALVGQRN